MIRLCTKLSALLAAALALASSAGGASLQPPSGTIALGSGGRLIFLVSLPAGTMATANAPDDLLGTTAVLSPDGTRIAIAGAKGIWVLQRDGSHARRILRNTGSFGFGDVAWSPAGTRLAFVRNGVLITANANGKQISHLTPHAASPSWSADGTRIVFVRGADASTLNGPIYSIGALGHDLRKLVPGRWYRPHVSPDGKRLLFSRHGADGIYTAPTAGGRARLLRHKGTQPEWSPDGRFVAFIRQVGCGEAACSSRVFIAPVAGGGGRPFGPLITDLGPFSWSR